MLAARQDNRLNRPKRYPYEHPRDFWAGVHFSKWAVPHDENTDNADDPEGAGGRPSGQMRFTAYDDLSDLPNFSESPNSRV
ncbi:MAG: hypothetical protein LC104_20070 [Bacteroidales bacterium]|nr:hypothetical protein [Bacteroidales bacterium]